MEFIAFGFCLIALWQLRYGELAEAWNAAGIILFIVELLCRLLNL